MDIAIINPFIQATTNALKVMAGIDIKRGIPFATQEFQPFADISGVIGLAGELKGAVVLSLSYGLAGHIYERMTGETVDYLDPALADLVGELANMVAGGAKGIFSGFGQRYDISVPVVATGKKHFIRYVNCHKILVVPFDVGDDTFWMQIALSESNLSLT